MQSSLRLLAGGALIGLSAVLLLVLNGRIAGISGIVGALFRAIDARLVTNAAFVIGLVLGPLLFLRMLVGMIAHDRLIPRLIPTEPMKGARP
jgi:uncharacterized membrane protein YedE/YeeE